jgi:hypothetical protein
MVWQKGGRGRFRREGNGVLGECVFSLWAQWMNGGWLAANRVKDGAWFWSGLLGKHLHGASFLFVLLFFCLVFFFLVSIFFCFTLFSFV